MIGYVITAAAVASALGYNTMAPLSQLYGASFTSNPAMPRKLALTYDDGPNEANTPRLLDVLARHNVRATFFMLGQYVCKLPKLAETVARAGHAVGNHTFNHPNLIFSTPKRLRFELEECRRALHDALGEHSLLFRPPYGGRRPGVFQFARSIGLVPVMWSVTGHDWDAQHAQQIHDRIARQLTGGDVILMHDGGPPGLPSERSATIAATDEMIPRYRDAGYEFVSVPELMG